MSHIAIIARETLFCEALSDIISRELAVSVTAMADEKTLQAMDESQILLIISALDLQKTYSCRVVSLRAGAPRPIGGLLAEIAQALAQRSFAPQTLSGMLQLDARSRLLRHAQSPQTVELTEKEQALLLYIKEQGEASREDILKHVWGFAPDVTTHTLETHLYRLRQKCRELADDDCIIATDKGYRWHDNSQ